MNDARWHRKNGISSALAGVDDCVNGALALEAMATNGAALALETLATKFII